MLKNAGAEGYKVNYTEPTWVGLVILAWDLGVCSPQGLRFDSLGANFGGLV